MLQVGAEWETSISDPRLTSLFRKGVLLVVLRLIRVVVELHNKSLDVGSRWSNQPGCINSECRIHQ